MSLNALKKTIVFSSLEGKNLIDAMLNDAATANGRTLSAALEYHLLYEPLLPSNQTASAWIILMYQKDKSIGDIIADCASYLSAVEKNRNTETFRTILEYCKIWGESTETNLSDKYAVSYLSNQVSCVIDEMKKIADTTNDIYLKTDMHREANRMQHIIDDAAEQITNAKSGIVIDALYFFEVLAAYPILEHCDRAYRLVSWLAKNCQWHDNAKSRYLLVRLLKKISRDWT